MDRYEISNDYRKKFIDENKNVIDTTIKPVYFSINGDEAKASKLPYSIENAEHALVVFQYSYVVITQDDKSMIPLFFNANGEVEDYIEIDGWRMSFEGSRTAEYKCGWMHVCMYKNGIGSSNITIYPQEQDIDKTFPRIWKLFCALRKCSCREEVYYLNDLYNKSIEIEKLNSEKIVAEAEIYSLKKLIKTYKALLDKISDLVGAPKDDSN